MSSRLSLKRCTLSLLLAAGLVQLPLGGSMSARFSHEVRAAGLFPAGSRLDRMIPLQGSVLSRLPTAGRLGRLAPNQILHVGVTLRVRNEASLQHLIAQQYDRHSPLYHHWITPREFADRFAPPATERGTLGQWLHSRGLQVTQRFANGMLLVAQGPARKVESAFGTHIYTFREGKHQFFANVTAVQLPSSVASQVVGVVGLNNRYRLSRQRPHLRHLGRGKRLSERKLHSDFQGYTPADLAKLYNVNPLYDIHLNGAGVTVGVVAADDVLDADIAAYDQQFGRTATYERVKVKDPEAKDPMKPGGETEMDTEVVQGVAPSAHILLYQDSNPYLSSIMYTFNQMVSENRAQVLTTSIDGAESTFNSSDITALHTAFQEAAAQGQTVFSASGDQAAFGESDGKGNHTTNLAVHYPCTDPYVTCVGGTSLYPASDGSYGEETVWSDDSDPNAPAGSTGGLSTLFHRPDYQSGVILSQYSNGMRQVPDVSALADNRTGYALYLVDDGGNSGNWTVPGGTSASAPFWAGLVALLVQNFKGRVGFINPTLYKLGAQSTTFSVPPFHDIVKGDNLHYPATPGYDLATGWGTPNAAALNNDIIKMGGFVRQTAAPSAHMKFWGIRTVTNGKWGWVRSFHLHQNIWFQFGYTTANAGTLTATGTITMVKNGTALKTYKMYPKKYTDGTSGLYFKTYFSQSSSVGANWQAVFRLKLGTAGDTQTFKFSVLS